MKQGTLFLNSVQKNIIGILLMISSACFVAVGQLFWKLWGGYLFHWLFIGFFLYGVGAVLMIAAFRFGSFSVLHPMLSVGYILALVLGYTVFGEPMHLAKVAGVIFIIAGTICIGGGDR